MNCLIFRMHGLGGHADRLICQPGDATQEYNGFNLVVGELRTGEVSLVSNRGGAAGPSHVDAATPAAICGVSNGPLPPDREWPKVAPVV